MCFGQFKVARASTSKWLGVYAHWKTVIRPLNQHPGEILLEEFLRPMGLSQNGLARAIHVSEGFFLGLQADYDLMERRRAIVADLRMIEPRAA
jgi:plasmid maintenance system antidote protein VapI